MTTLEHNNHTYNFKVFDAHNHIGLDKEGMVNATSYNDLMGAIGDIEKTILFPSNSPSSGPFSIIPNMEVLDIAQKSNGRVIPFYRFDIFEAEGCKYWQTGICSGIHNCLAKKYFRVDCCSGFNLDQFFEEMKHTGFMGLKLHPRASEINYATLHLDSDIVLKTINAAGRVGLVVTIHTHNMKMVSEYFNLAKSVLPKYDKLVLICAHSGGGSTQLKRRLSREYVGKKLNEFLEEEGEWTNRMLFETSNMFWKYLLNGLLLCDDLSKTARSLKNVDNIVYGTDWPFVKDISPTEKANETINALLAAGFSDESIEKIMATNLEERMKCAVM